LGTYLSIVQIIVSIALVVLIVLQAQGHGVGGVFGGQSSVAQSRRGAERTLHQLTIAFSVLFLVVSLLNVLAY
jgi:preprotein translocase subunit SecG